MPTIKKAALAAIIITSFSSAVASASVPAEEPNKIEFKGSIISSTCQVDQRSKNAIVPMGGVPIASLGTAEYTGTNFELYFTGCNANDKPKVKFTQLDAAGLIALDSASTPNAAKNVAIQLFSANGQPITAATATEVRVPVDGSNGTLSLYAKYVKTGGQISTGQANATTTFVVTYN